MLRDFDDVSIRALKPYVIEWINQANLGTVTTITGTGGTGGTGDGLSEAAALALFYTQTQIDAWRTSHLADPNAHHAKVHPFLGTDHTYPALVEGDVIYSDDGAGLVAGTLSHNYLSNVDPNQHHNQAHEATSTADHIAPGTTNSILGTRSNPDVFEYWYAYSDHTQPGVRGELLRSTQDGSIALEWIDIDQYVNTPQIKSDLNIALKPALNGGDVTWRGDLVSENHISTLSGILLRSDTGLIDTQTIQAKNAYFEAIIAQAKRAEFGASIWAKGYTTLTRPFTIPVFSTWDYIYLADLDGLAGYDVLQDYDDVRVTFRSEGDPVYAAPTQVASDAQGVTGTSGDPQIFYDNFETKAVGTSLGADWYETGQGNSMGVDDAVASIADVGGAQGKVIELPTTNFVNAHVHYVGSGYNSLTDYEITGKVWRENDSAGIGITFGSQYGPGGTDEYYRVRTYSTVGLELSNHGTVGNGTGTISSAVIPAAQTWYRFRVQYENTGTQINIKARMWQDGTTEPATWDIDAVDSTANRNTTGTFGFWEYGAGVVRYDEIDVTSLAGAAPSVSTIALSPDGTVLTDDVEVIVVAQVDTETITISGPTLTLVSTETQGGYTSSVYWYRYASNAGDGNWLFESDGFGDLVVLNSTWRGIDDSGSAVEYNYSTAGNSSNLLQPTATPVSVNSASLAIIVQHNEAGQATYSDAPDNYELSTSYVSGDRPTIFVHSDILAATTAPSITWTPPSLREHALHHIILSTAPPNTVSFVWGQAYGWVLEPTQAEIDGLNLESDEQVYRFYPYLNTPGQGETVSIDAAVLNYGDYNASNPQGVLEITSLDQAGAPYMQMGLRQEYDSVTGTIPISIRSRIGNLDGIGTLGPNEWGAYFTSGPSDVGEIILSTERFVLSNVDIVLDYGGWDGGTPRIRLGLDTGLQILSKTIGSVSDPLDITFHAESLDDTAMASIGLAYDNIGIPGIRFEQILDAGTWAGGTDFIAERIDEVKSDGIDVSSQWSMTVSHTNPYSEAHISMIAHRDGSGSDVTIQGQDLLSLYAFDRIRMSVDDNIEMRFQYSATQNLIFFDDANASTPRIGLRMTGAAGSIPGWDILTEFADRGLYFKDALNNTFAFHLRQNILNTTDGSNYSRFLVPLMADGFLAGYGGTSNIDHIWHDDGGNAWHFVSDGTYKQTGNATVQAYKYNGTQLWINANAQSSVSTQAGWAVIYVNSFNGDLEVRFPNGTVKTIVTN